MPHKPGRIFIDGKRFEAAISASRTMADIEDRKLGKKIVLLDRDNLEELGKVVTLILDGDPVLVDGVRFEGMVSMNRQDADIFDRRYRHKFIALDRAALEELRQMVEEILEVFA